MESEEQELKKQYGEPLLYDPEFKGAKIERRPTDRRCFILFVVCFVIWAIIGIFAIFQGNLSVYTDEFDFSNQPENVTQHIESLTETLIHDLKAAWPTMIFGLGFGIVACLLFIAVMRWFAGFVAWASIIIFVGMFGVGALICVIVAAVSESHEEKTFLLFFITLFASIFVILLIAVTCFRRRIALSIELIKEASKATNANILIMIFPIVQSLMEVMVLILAAYIGLKLSTIGTAIYQVEGHNYNPNSTYEDLGCECNGIKYYDYSSCDGPTFRSDCLPKCPTMSCNLVEIENNFVIQFFMAYTLFEYLWIMFFITAFVEMVLGGVFALWYWTMNKDNIPPGAFWDSFNRTYKFHLGTLAFGSLLITIIRIIRMIISSIRDNLKKSKNPFAKIALVCLECIIASIEEFIEMINRRAYILTAVHGTDFFTSAKNAFNLVMRNILGILVLNNVTGMVFFMMELLISIGVTACFCTALIFIHPTVIEIEIWTIAFFIIIILISAMFFSVFDMAVDTLFICFLEDLERNDGSPEKPYYMSDKLREILQKED